MKIMGNCGGHRFVLAAALSIGLGFGTRAQAVDHSYLIDLSSRTATDLGSLNATAINDTGQVVGQSGTSGSQYRAFITGSDGVGITDLGTLGGGVNYVHGINAVGEVVGSSITAAPQYQYHAFITGSDGVGITDLGTLGGSDSGATGINTAGRVVGYSLTGNGPAHAFITGANGVGMTDLGTLGGNESFATGINAAGQVVGDSLTTTGSDHAFMTGPNGMGMTDLGTLGRTESVAFGINDTGQVVGWADTTTGQQHAFITGPNGVGMIDLNSLIHLPAGVVLTDAVGINNMGQVIALEHTGVVPEPESYALMLAGLALMGAMVRRKHKA